MKFIHLTDLHLTKPGQLLWGLDPMARLQSALDDIRKHHPDAERLIITGDLTEWGEREAYAALKQMLAGMPMPAHLMLGNHDEREAYYSVFSGPKDDNGFAQHAIDTRVGRMLFLDTLKGPPSSAGLYCAARRQWLQRELAAGGPVWLFMHHPPMAIAHPLMDLIALEDGESFSQMLAPHDVRHLFFGHAHRIISGQWRGIPFSALPSLNHQLPLVGGAVATIYSDEPPAYAVVHIEKDTTLVHTDCWLDREPAAMAPEAERGTWY
jgi:Icc protein